MSAKLHIGGSPFWNRTLFEAGCRLVGDLFRPDGIMKTYDELNKDFPIPFGRTVLQGLIRAIRKSYDIRSVPSKVFGPSRPEAVECLFADKTGNRSIYIKFLEHIFPASSDLSKAESKWNRELNVEIDWSTVYSNYKSCTRNTKIIWFQDRLLHRILTTNHFVARFTNVEPACSFCKRDTETLIHLFCRCEVISRLWSELKRVASRSGVTLFLCDKNIITGQNVMDDSFSLMKRNMVSQMILLFKFYIYRARIASGEIRFWTACAYVKDMICADRPMRKDVSSDVENKVHEGFDWVIDMLGHWLSLPTMEQAAP